MKPKPAAGKSRLRNDPGKAWSSSAGPCRNERGKETETQHPHWEAPREDGLGRGWGRFDPAPAAQSADLHKQGSRFPPNLEPQL